mmetsp:Transcript_28821/g.57768  ORF Transcript_28821/g.57768 Transcript_28821/m.57768 type:complete len:518 (-) Transcript_28821:167-1720(-)
MRNLFSTLLAFLASTSPSSAQTICSCSPVSYTFRLNLEGTCDDNAVEGNPGIQSTDCTIVVDATNLIDPEFPTLEDILSGIPWISKRAIKKASKNRRNPQKAGRNGGGRVNTKLIDENGEEVRKLQSAEIPVSISSIQFIELNSEGNVINFDESFTDVDVTDGFAFTFQSVSSQLANDLVIEDQLEFVPDTAVVFIIGQNSDGNEVRGRFVVRFTNSCGSNDYTVLGGERFAWITYSDIGEASTTFCPATVDQPTTSPVLQGESPPPTSQPQRQPTREPTTKPTILPTDVEDPTPNPTSSPTPDPTNVPTNPPTIFVNPTYKPTMSPTRNPTRSPTRTPARNPTRSPTRNPTPDPTKKPTRSPIPEIATVDPTEIPTYRPTTWFPTYFPTQTFSPTTWLPTSYGEGTETPTYYDENSMSMMIMDITHIVLPYFHGEGKSGKGMKWGKSGKSTKVSKSSGGKSAKPVNIVHLVTVPQPHEEGSWSSVYDDDDEDSLDGGGYGKPVEVVMTNGGKAGKR